jgi:NAD(P)-dependent dehydrogenase (short-subunit alcohol dehydrogenase family)
VPAVKASYSASKYALEAATEALAIEMAQFNVFVKLVEPGVVLTPILTKAAGDEGQGAERRPVNRQSPYIDLIRYVNKWCSTI